MSSAQLASSSPSNLPVISLVVLGYRAGESLVEIVERATAVLDDLDRNWEAILVANFSSLDDETPRVASGGYAESKLAAEGCARALGPPVTVLRPAEVWGATRPGPIEALAGLVRRGILPVLRGQPQPSLAPLHAIDLAAAVVATVARPAAPEPMILDGPERWSWNALIEHLRRELAPPGSRERGLVIRFPVLLLRLASRLPVGTDRVRRLLAPRPDDDGSAWRQLGISPRSLDSSVGQTGS